MIVGEIAISIKTPDRQASVVVTTDHNAFSDFRLWGINRENLIELLEATLDALEAMDKLEEIEPCGRS